MVNLFKLFVKILNGLSSLVISLYFDQSKIAWMIRQIRYNLVRMWEMVIIYAVITVMCFCLGKFETPTENLQTLS